jgi:hypothetical protein
MITVWHSHTANSRRTPAPVRAIRKFLQANDEAGEQQLYDRLACVGSTLRH